MITWDEQTTPHNGKRMNVVIRTGVATRLRNMSQVARMRGQYTRAKAIEDAVLWLAERAAVHQSETPGYENIPGLVCESFEVGSEFLHLTAIYGMVVTHRTMVRVRGDFYLVVVPSEDVDEVLEGVFQWSSKLGLQVERPREPKQGRVKAR